MANNKLPEVPALESSCRLNHDEANDRRLLLYPEGAMKLNRTGYEILDRLNGNLTLVDLIDHLETEFEEDELGDPVRSFLADMVEQGVVVDASGS